MDVGQSLTRKYKNRLKIEAGAFLKDHEWEMLNTILGNLPGDFIVQKVSDVPGEKIADIRYNGSLAELKKTSGLLTTLDGHIRRAIKQTRGGIAFIDITGATYSNTDAIATIINRMHRSGLNEAYLMRNKQVKLHIIQHNREFMIKKITYRAPTRGAR